MTTPGAAERERLLDRARHRAAVGLVRIVDLITLWNACGVIDLPTPLRQELEDRIIEWERFR